MKKLVLSIVVLALVVGAVAASAITPQEVRVKKAIADRMTPEELAAYKERLAERVNQGLLGDRLASPVVPTTPADLCTAATYEVSTLPYNGPADTTVGLTDNYDLPADTAAPTCTASTNCTGAGGASSLPRGAIYTGTGTGPDKAYRIRTSANCDLTITMDPTGTEDMGLIVYQANCSNLLSDCVCVDDTGVGGTAESVTLNAVAGTDYYVVIDGYSTSAVPPGPSGPFTLSITGSGCTLTPVELQSLSVQ